MHESESSSSHSVLESKSSHESLNLAHESDSSPSPGLEYYNTASPDRPSIRRLGRDKSSVYYELGWERVEYQHWPPHIDFIFITI